MRLAIPVLAVAFFLMASTLTAEERPAQRDVSVAKAGGGSIDWPTVAKNQLRRNLKSLDCGDGTGCILNPDPDPSGDSGAACANKSECASDRCTSTSLTQVVASCRWIIIGNAWSCASC